MLGLAIGQIFIGPLSDKYGCKQPLLITFFLFVVSTSACIFSWNIESFIVFRFIQGFAGAGGIVISRSIVVDLFKDKEFANFFSLLAIIQAIAPILAPVLGGLLLEVTDWRGIFVTLVVIEISTLFMLFPFKESLAKHKRTTGRITNVFKGYGLVLKNKKFVYLTLIQAFAMGMMFAYIASSPFIFQEVYGLSPLMYSLCFGLNAVALIIGNIIITKFSNKDKALVWGAKTLIVMGVLVAFVLSFEIPFLILEILFFAFMFSLGMILPTSTALALDIERDNSGSASAVFGFMSFLVGGIASPLTGIGNILLSTGIIIIICCAGIALSTYKVKQVK